MPTLKVGAFLVLLSVLQNCDCQTSPPSQITLSRTTVTISPNASVQGDSLTVRCQPPTTGVSFLFELRIQRVPHDSPNSAVTVLASAALQTNDGNAQLGSGISDDDFDVSGSTGTSSVTLTVRNPRCNDAGTYTCIANYSPSNPSAGGGFGTSSGNVTVEATPGHLTLDASPNDQSLWRVNDILTLECDGPVGTLQTSDQRAIIWQYKIGTNTFDQWLPYDGPESDIQQGMNTDRQCYREQRSTLRRTLQLNDTRRYYRCIPRWKNSDYEQYADTFYVGTVTLDGTMPDQGGSADNSSKAEAGAIAGGVIGSLFVIAIVVVLIYFLVIRPRRRRQKEEDGEDGNAEKPPPGDEEPSHLADPSVIYSKPKKEKSRGVTNEGVEYEPGDKPVDNDSTDKQHGRRKKSRKDHDDLPAPSTPDTEDKDSDNRRGRRDKNRPDVNDEREDPQLKRSDDRRRRRHQDDDSFNIHDQPYNQPYDPPAQNRYSNDKFNIHDQPYNQPYSRPARNRYSDDDDHGYRGGRHNRDDGHRGGRRNRGYDPDASRDRQYSSDDGGTDSYVNLSQGDGDPTMGTAI